MTDKDVFEKLAEFREKRIPCCLATIVDAAGSTPREVGAKMIICADGAIFGSIGGGCGENQVCAAAYRTILVNLRPQLLEVDLTDDLGIKGGDVCGGKMLIFIEPFVY